MTLDTEKKMGGAPLFPHLPNRLAGLEELAENLWWSWNPARRMVKQYVEKFYDKSIQRDSNVC